MDRNISLAVIKRTTPQDGQLIATPGDWQRPFVIVLGIWARFISPRQLEETALALRIRHAVLRWIKLVLFLFPLFSKLPAWIYNRDSRPSQSRVSADLVAPRNAAVSNARGRICYVDLLWPLNGTFVCLKYSRVLKEAPFMAIYKASR